MNKMQKWATRVFIVASVVFGIAGLLMVIMEPGSQGTGTWANEAIGRILQATVFIILPAFALSVAGKYLSHKK